MCKNFQIRGKMSLRPFFYIWGMRLWAFFFWYTNNNICHAELVSASTQYIVMSSRTLRFFARTCYKEYFGISLVSLWIKWNCGHFSKKKGTSAIFYDEIPFVIYNSTSSEQNNEIPSSGNLSFTAFTMAFTFSAFSFVT